MACTTLAGAPKSPPEPDCGMRSWRVGEDDEPWCNVGDTVYASPPIHAGDCSESLESPLELGIRRRGEAGKKM